MSTGRPRRRRLAVAAIALTVAAAAVATVVINPLSRSGALDPEGTGDDGSRALVRVLERSGITVETANRLEQVRRGERGTVLVIGADLLGAGTVDELSDAHRSVVLLSPGSQVLEDLGVEADALGTPVIESIPPACDLGAARAAGELNLSGTVYAPSDPEAEDLGDGVEACYPAEDLAGSGRVLALRRGTSEVAVLGSQEPLTNRRVDEAGNAALAMWLLGSEQRLVWWRVDPADPALAGETRPSPADLAPPWVLPALVWLGLVAAIAVVWRARRFGPLVPEPLPVVVRSAETTRGRAALYREGRSTSHAATLLRTGALQTLASRRGMEAGVPAGRVAESVASDLGLAPEQVHQLLAGPGPGDAAGLTRLADDLDELVARDTPTAALRPDHHHREDHPSE